ncbi:hypothetical protein [Sulfobacillus harzensis]|uniref:Uncharacterized protein n=1 Tax=Sulfobacillus harzensis TaxID=2729629 RepID=A0A7Y0Q2R5_9FIRM|nr:hypothetical protein [Sulfobacillus harzensis]NMP23448.1 hypothetical protein [Sulfobacillus harzensis]
MNRSDTMNEEIAVIIEQYADRAEARLPGMGPDWHTVGSTPNVAIEPLMERLRSRPEGMSADPPVAVSLLAVTPETSDLRPPMVVYAPDGVMALFSGDLDPFAPPPPEAIWLKPGERIPDDAPDGSVFVMPHRTPPFHPNTVVIRTHGGGHRLLHHTGGGVLLSPARHAVSRIHRERPTSATPPPEPAAHGPDTQPDHRIAVLMEQYRDHAEAYLPGMGRAWHTTDVTPDGALEYLLQLVRRHHPVIPNGIAPVAVSLVTVHPDTADLHPAMVEYAPAGAMVLFSGRLLPAKVPPPQVHRLRPGDRIPDGAPRGRVFLVPPTIDGLDHEGRCPPDAVVLHAQPGEDHCILHHTGRVVLKFPARLVRIGHGPWGEARHEVHPVKQNTK